MQCKILLLINKRAHRNTSPWNTWNNRPFDPINPLNFPINFLHVQLFTQRTFQRFQRFRYPLIARVSSDVSTMTSEHCPDDC
jgi:hypothetical protein